MLKIEKPYYVTHEKQAALDEFNLPDSLLISKIYYSKNVVKLAEKAILISDSLSEKVKQCLFEALVKDHILYREEFVNHPALKGEASSFMKIRLIVFSGRSSVTTPDL